MACDATGSRPGSSSLRSPGSMPRSTRPSGFARRCSASASPMRWPPSSRSSPATTPRTSAARPSASPAGGTSALTVDELIKQRLDKAGRGNVNDVVEIAYRYAAGIDLRDWSAYRAVFAEEVDLDFSSYRGRPTRVAADD